MEHIGTQTIETHRLLLRKYVLADADDMFRNWVTDPEVSRFWRWKPHESIDETKTWLQQWISNYTRTDYYHWVIILKESSEAAGYIYLDEINEEERSASVHYLVSRKLWNQGIMTEACKAVLRFSFSKIGFVKIYGYHHADNPASGKVLKKSGMRYIETKYREIPDCERICGDYHFYEATWDDWISSDSSVSDDKTWKIK